MGLGLEKCVKLLHYPLVTFFSTVTDDLSPRKYRIRSYDILNVLWTYIYSEMLPITKWISFLCEQIRLTIHAINHSSRKGRAVICDDNRNKQVFFRLLDTETQKPWLTEAGRYLLLNFIHYLNNVRYDWLMEKTVELAFSKAFLHQEIMINFGVSRSVTKTSWSWKTPYIWQNFSLTGWYLFDIFHYHYYFDSLFFKVLNTFHSTLTLSCFFLFYITV